MKRAVILTVLAGLPTTIAGAAQAPPGLPRPATVVAPAPAPPAARRPRITLGEKTEEITPEACGAAHTEETAIGVRAVGNTLTAVLSGVAHAHSSLLGHATGVATLELAQEFTIDAGNSTSWVSLSLAARIEGYLRTDANGAACLRAANVTVHPACGGPALSLGFAPGCIAGRCGNSRYVQSAQFPPQFVPPGKYVLLATLVIDARVDGIFQGHGEAVFTSAYPGVIPSLINNPFEDLDRKNFGFRITVQVQ